MGKSLAGLSGLVVFFLFSLFSMGTWAQDFEGSIVGPWSPLPNGKARIIEFDEVLQTPREKPIKYALEVRLDKDWHTYWMNSGDSGAAPEIYALGATPIKTEIRYPYPERILAPPLVTFGYSEHVIYFFNLPPNTLELRADLLVCKEECLPGSFTQDLPLQISNLNFKAKDSIVKNLKQFYDRLPEPPPANMSPQYVSGIEASNWSLTLDKTATVSDLFWYPEQVPSLKKPNFIREDTTVNFYLQEGPQKNRSKKALLLWRPSQDSELTSTVLDFIAKDANVWPFALMALVGGLILNLMPCVFPIVSLKAFSIANSSGKPLQQIRKDHAFYSLGVIACFLLLGFFIAILRSSGQIVGWGFQLQNPWFVGFLSGLFLFLAFSFFDLWHWNWIPKFASTTQLKEGPWGSIGTGFLAVLVASPCTAPFMGAAIGFALSQSALSIFVIFASLGIGMALPFIGFAAAPSLSKLLPSPGAWMNTFKKCMGVMLLLTSIWLGWLTMQITTSSQEIDGDFWTELKIAQWDEKIESGDGARFVNFTADWCVTCKVNERVTFQNEDVRTAVQAQKLKMYRVDWTKKESEIAAKLAEYGRAGVPLYLYYRDQNIAPIILPGILTPDLFIETITQEETK